MSPKEIELKYLIARDAAPPVLPPPLPASWSYSDLEARRELLSDEYLDDERSQLAVVGLSVRRRVSEHVPVEPGDPVTTYWLKGRETPDGALHVRLERELSGLDDPALLAAIPRRGGAAMRLHVQVRIKQQRRSWELVHGSGVRGTLSVDHVSGLLRGVGFSWDELEIEIHAPVERAKEAATELDGALKQLLFLTPSHLAKIDRANYLVAQSNS